MYTVKKKAYNQHIACEKEVLDYLRKKFPTLKSKYAKVGAFLVTYTAMKAMKDLIAVYDNDNKSCIAAMKYHNKIASLEYKHTSEGPQAYFEEVDQLAKQLDDLEMFQVTVCDKMTYTPAAFQKSTIPPNVMREIKDKWKRR